MVDSPVVSATRLLRTALDGLVAAAGSASDGELLSVLTVCEGASRRLDHLSCTATAGLERRGVFAARGYPSVPAALADLLGWDRGEAGRRHRVATQTAPRVGLDGQGLPARLEATAALFGSGEVSLRHVEVITRELDTAAARRFAPQVWAAAEAEIAAKAPLYTPAELGSWARALVETLDDDGPEPRDTPPEPRSELYLNPRADGSGGRLRADLDALAYAAVAAAVDALAKPLNAEDTRGVPQRQADALAEICGFALNAGADGPLPECGGERPHLTVVVPLEELEERARTALLDFGGHLHPAQLRLLACDARVVPVVLDGAGQPLDVGRARRTIPDGLRRAVAARDRGCAHPGCGRPASWSEIHHIRAWEDGGETKLENLIMLCRFHHRLLHRRDWTVRIRDGLPEFIPPAWIDPQQRLRRNPVVLVA